MGVNLKVSVIIPIYNVESYVEECINSVRNQSLTDIEIICVNDKGTDDSWEIVKRMAKEDSRIILIENDCNRGLSYTRNHGLGAAKGEYIYFLDSDDYIVPDCLMKLYQNAVQENLEIQIFEAEFVYESEELRPIFSKNPSSFKVEYNEIYDGKSLFVKWMDVWDWMPSQPRFFYSRDFLMKNNLSFVEGMLHEDEIFTFDVLMNAVRIRIVNEKLFCRRFRKDSIMTVRPVMNHFRGCILILQHVYKYLLNLKSDFSTFENSIKFYMSKIASNARNKYHNIEDTPDKTPEISVIIPCYNVEKYIEECLNSVILQSIWNIEIICINDGSSDNTLSLLNKFERIDPRINVYNLEENRGQSVARNVGLSMASGKYIYMLDADDYIVDGAFEELLQYAEKDDADVIAFENQQFSDNPVFGEKAKEVLFSYKGYAGTFRGTDAFSILISRDIISPSVPTYMIKKDYIDNLGLRFIENIIHEDIGFILEMLVFSKITVLINKPYFMRRFRAGSTVTSKLTSRNIEGYLRSFIRSYELMPRFTDEHKENLIFQHAFRKWQRDVLGRIRTLYMSGEKDLFKEAGGNVDECTKLLFEAVKLTTTGPARAEEILGFTKIQDEVYISGTGQYANRIIDVIGATETEIKGIIDTDGQYKKRTLRGFRVFKPWEIADKDIQVLLAVSHYNLARHCDILKADGFTNIQSMEF